MCGATGDRSFVALTTGGVTFLTLRSIRWTWSRVSGGSVDDLEGFGHAGGGFGEAGDMGEEQCESEGQDEEDQRDEGRERAYRPERKSVVKHEEPSLR
ncbi:hypothetical protein LP422_11070 [Janibacter limosus]|uniref:Uncharacterized protein n=1 Tax=Janibacter limosus TaxID=53458 RepID=A0AC61U0M6_9MICO|nr:hypothetical protein [Janibacter limosus]UUZ43551.1 hypothetical protein LP422_11070 [Janibacter limosus]